MNPLKIATDLMTRLTKGLPPPKGVTLLAKSKATPIGEEWTKLDIEAFDLGCDSLAILLTIGWGRSIVRQLYFAGARKGNDTILKVYPTAGVRGYKPGSLVNLIADASEITVDDQDTRDVPVIAKLRNMLADQMIAEIPQRLLLPERALHFDRQMAEALVIFLKWTDTLKDMDSKLVQIYMSRDPFGEATRCL